MTSRRQIGRPFATVAFLADRKKPQQQPQDVLIRQREYKHDVAVISIEQESKAQKKYAHGAPVTITWGWRPDDVETFHGYVHHTAVRASQHKLPMLEVYCVGASYRMKQIRLRSFQRKFAHQIAAIIAKEHHFSLLVKAHVFRHAQITQHGRSDWDILVWLAKQIGYTFYANKTDLVMVPRVIDNKPSAKRPTFILTTGTYRQRGALYKITHKVGEAVPGTENKARVLGAMTNTGKPIQHRTFGPTKHLPIFGKVSMKRPAHTPVAARAQLDGEAALHRFNTTAEVELSGNTKVHQGSTVRLAGMDEDSDGFWYVTGVDHHITVSDYRLKATVVRDTLGEQPETVEVSDSGNPVVLTDCDVSVSGKVTSAPETVYTAVDDCSPIEAAVAERESVTLPFDIDPTRRRRFDKRLRSPARRAVAPILKRPPVKAHARPPKLTGWRAGHHTVRNL